MANQIRGGCLCGAVRVTAEVEEEVFDACHCGMCRRWSGGPIMTVHTKAGVEFTGEESIAIYNSSAWAERGFCKSCGTHLFYRLKKQKEHFIPLGLLESTEDFKFYKQIFIDMKPDSYSFANVTETMTQEEVFKQASSS